MATIDPKLILHILIIAGLIFLAYIGGKILKNSKTEDQRLYEKEEEWNKWKNLYNGESKIKK